MCRVANGIEVSSGGNRDVNYYVVKEQTVKSQLRTCAHSFIGVDYVNATCNYA